MQESTEQRPAASEVFFVIPENQRFYEGRATHLSIHRRTEYLLSFASVFILSGAGIVWLARLLIPSEFGQALTTQEAQLGSICFCLLPSTFSLIITAAILHQDAVKRKKLAPLEKTGTLLLGEVISYRVVWRGLPWRGSSTVAVLHYRFHPPDAPELVRQKEWPELPFVRRPQPGMPVAILYANQRNFEVL